MALMEQAEQEIGDLIGDEATLQLVENFGGTRLPIPTNPVGSQLRLVIGDAAAARLSELHGGTSLKVPLARAWRARVYRERGYSYSRIAVKLLISESGVHNMLRAGGLTNEGRPKVAAPPGTNLSEAVGRTQEEPHG